MTTPDTRPLSAEEEEAFVSDHIHRPTFDDRRGVRLPNCATCRLLATLDAERARHAAHREVCHDNNPNAVIAHLHAQYDALEERHAALVAAAASFFAAERALALWDAAHGYVVNSERDAMAGALDEAREVLYLRAALNGEQPETCCYTRAAGLTCAYHAALDGEPPRRAPALPPSDPELLR